MMKFYGQHDLDRILYEKYFQQKKEGFFVECGAYDGIGESTCMFFEESMDWRGLNIEPVPFTFNRLIKARPKSINEMVALSDKNERRTFSQAVHPILENNFGNGSLTHTVKHLDELNQIGCTFEKFEVQCVRFEDLFNKYNLPPIDLFVLDVEGHELSALDGILTIPKTHLPKVFCIEHTLSDLDKIAVAVDGLYYFDGQHRQNAFFLRVPDES